MPSSVASLAAAVFALAATASGCGTAGPDVEAGPLPTPQHHRAPPSTPTNPDTVCREFAHTYVSMDTRRDADPSAARERAAHRYGTPKLRHRLAASGDTAARSRFAEWGQHNGHVEITDIRPVRDDPPPTTGATTAAGFVLSGHVAGSRDWSQNYGPVVVYCSLTQRPDGWRVDQVQISRGDR